MKDYKFLRLPVFLYVFFLAVFLRLYNLGVPGIWVDEAFSIWLAKFSLPQVIKLVSTDAHPPLYFIFLHYWIKLFGASEFAARSLSVIFSLGTVILIYRLCNELFGDKKYGILSSVLFSVSSFAIIMIDTDIKMYSLLTFLTVLSAYLLVKLTKCRGGVTPPLQMGLCVLYVATLILLLYTHYFSFFIIIAQLLYIILFYKNTVRAGFKPALTIVFILLAAFLPWSNVFFKQFFVYKGGELLSKPSFLSLCLVFNNFFIMYPWKIVFWSETSFFAAIFIFLLIAGIKMFKTKKNPIIILSLVMIIGLPYIISLLSNYKHIFQTRYCIPAFPFFVILLSFGILIQKSKVFKYLLVITFITLNLISYNLYVSDSKYWKQDFRSVAKYVDERAKPADIVLLQVSYNIFPFNYYYKNALAKISLKRDEFSLVYNLKYPDEYFAKGGVYQVVLDVFDEGALIWSVNNFNKVFYVLNAEQKWDPERKNLKWLQKNCVFLEGVEVENYYGGQGRITVGVFKKKR